MLFADELSFITVDLETAAMDTAWKLPELFSSEQVATAAKVKTVAMDTTWVIAVLFT